MLAFLGHIQDLRYPGPQHKYGGFPSEGQFKFIATLKAKTLSATSFACRALHNVAKTEKRVYPGVTIVFHVPKSPRLSLPLFFTGSKVISRAFAEEREPANEASDVLRFGK